MKFPQTEEDWQNICRSYDEKWQFPNCFDAADGKPYFIIKSVCKHTTTIKVFIELYGIS